jgi:type II secretory pathway pseudopilin PulG
MKIGWQEKCRYTWMIFALVTLSNVVAAQDSQRQKPEQSQQQNTYREQAQDTQRDQQQKQTQSYSGKISQKFGKYYLENPRDKSSYVLDGRWDIKNFIDKKVRVTGTLDADRNILRVIAISPLP